MLPNEDTNVPYVANIVERTTKTKYTNLMKDDNVKLLGNKGISIEPIPIKLVSFVDGVPHVTWTEEEVETMYIFGKFIIGCSWEIFLWMT